MPDGSRAGAAPRAAIRRQAILVAAVVVAALAAAMVYSFAAPKRYEARAKVLVSPIGDDPSFAGLSVLRESDGGRRALETAAELVKTRETADAVAVRLGAASGEELLDAVEAEPAGEGNVLEIEGHASDGARAAQIANGFADELVARRSARFQTELAARLDRIRAELDGIPAARRDTPRAVALERQLAHLAPLVGGRDPTLLVVADAVAPHDAAWPRPELVIPVAGLAALVLALTWLAVPKLARRRGLPASGGLARSADETAAQTLAAELERGISERMDALLDEQQRLSRRQATLAVLERSPAESAERDELSAKRQAIERRLGELETRLRRLDEQERALAERRGELDEHERALAEREARLAQRVEAITRREAALARRAAEVATRPAAPTPPLARDAVRSAAAGPRTPPGAWNLGELERLVAEHGDEHPDRLEEWSSYLFLLREHAELDGTLPSSFDYLVEEVFGEELAAASD